MMHATRTYLTEEGKQVESSEDFLEQLRSLPQAADEVLGEQLSEHQACTCLCSCE